MYGDVVTNVIWWTLLTKITGTSNNRRFLGFQKLLNSTATYTRISLQGPFIKSLLLILFCRIQNSDLGGVSRYFEATSILDGCPGDSGWFMVIDTGVTGGCPGTDQRTTVPYFLYSSLSTTQPFYGQYDINIFSLHVLSANQKVALLFSLQL